MRIHTKQVLYEDMLRFTLAYLRNQASFSWWRRILDRSAYYETQLIHNLPNSIFKVDFVEHDIWFLNVQAKFYYLNCNAKLSPIYNQQIDFLCRLFEIVPEELRCQLEWDGPCR